MFVPGRVLVFASAVVVVAIGAVGVEAWRRQQDVRALRQEIAAVKATSESAVAAAGQASSAASQAVDQAKQAAALAAAAKHTADQTAAQAVGTPGPASAPAQQPAVTAGEQDIRQGRGLALLICTACHVVAPEQALAPRHVPPGPEFRVIANRPATTPKSLHDFLAAPHGGMPEIPLADYQIGPIVSYIMSLRDRH